MQRDEMLNALGLTLWRLRGTVTPIAGADTPTPLQEHQRAAEVVEPGASSSRVHTRFTPSLHGRGRPEEVGEGENKTPPLQEVGLGGDGVSFSPPLSAPFPRGEKEASPGTRAQRIAQLLWDDFAADVAACTSCDLCKTRTKAVPGVGDVRARWLFVGEGPGAEEDKKGEPFVGQAGRLLDQMLAALGMKRGNDVYIANVLKCRPPNNRAPTPQEADACRPYLERQIALIQPEIIVALGKSAAMLLLNTDASIASLRGRVHRYREVLLVVTYHPAYLLRNPADKAKSWEDLVFTKKILAAKSA